MSGGGVTHGSGLVVNGDQGAVRINIAVAAGHGVPVPALSLGDEGLLLLVSHFVLVVVLGGTIVLLRVGGHGVAQGLGGHHGPGPGGNGGGPQGVGHGLGDGGLKGCHDIGDELLLVGSLR